MASCYHCNANLDHFLVSKVSRQDSCPKCLRDLRVCKNCSFYEPNSHWECKEEVAEHILDKEKANFCDHFRLNPASRGASAHDTKNDLLSAAEALFKKKQ